MKNNNKAQHCLIMGTAFGKLQRTDVTPSDNKILQLPPEILVKIFTYLNEEELINVSSEFRDETMLEAALVVKPKLVYKPTLPSHALEQLINWKEGAEKITSLTMINDLRSGVDRVELVKSSKRKGIFLVIEAFGEESSSYFWKNDKYLEMLPQHCVNVEEISVYRNFDPYISSIYWKWLEELFSYNNISKLEEVKGLCTVIADRNFDSTIPWLETLSFGLILILNSLVLTERGLKHRTDCKKLKSLLVCKHVYAALFSQENLAGRPKALRSVRSDAFRFRTEEKKLLSRLQLLGTTQVKKFVLAFVIKPSPSINHIEVLESDEIDFNFQFADL